MYNPIHLGARIVRHSLSRISSDLFLFSLVTARFFSLLILISRNLKLFKQIRISTLAARLINQLSINYIRQSFSSMNWMSSVSLHHLYRYMIILRRHSLRTVLNAERIIISVIKSILNYYLYSFLSSSAFQASNHPSDVTNCDNIAINVGKSPSNQRNLLSLPTAVFIRNRYRGKSFKSSSIFDFLRNRRNCQVSVRATRHLRSAQCLKVTSPSYFPEWFLHISLFILLDVFIPIIKQVWRKCSLRFWPPFLPSHVPHRRQDGKGGNVIRLV